MHRITTAKIKWTNFKPRQASLLQHSNFKAPVELEPNFGKIIHKTKPTLQHSYSKAPVELEPKFGQTILKTKPTNYNTATPILQWC